VNALHFFALSANTEGITFCFQNHVPFMTDLFGNNPLSYALASKDQPALNAVISGIYGLETETRIEVMK
jgi:hypothetical protein